MTLRRMIALLGAAGCLWALAGSTASAAGEEIVIETSPLTPQAPTQWIDHSVATTQAAWLLGYATCLKLLDYDEESGALRPEAAAAMPTVSAGGTRYTFTVADGHRFFVPPDGGSEDVTAASFKRAIERATSPSMAASISGSPAARSIMAGIVGASAFFSGAASEISGLQASGDVLTVDLVAPDPVFSQRIAMPFFCATHSGAPAGYSFTPPLSAGPYFVSSAFASGTPPSTTHEIVLQRNPYYGGTRTRNLGTIRWVEQGSALAEDHVSNAPFGYTAPPGMSVLANITTGIQLFALNTSRAPFSAVETRRAASYALDRTALSSVLGWQATDQFVSPLLPGYQDADVYPLAGNPDTARSLLAGATPAVTLCHPGGARGQVAGDAAGQLEAVGFDVTVVAPGNYFTYIANPANCDLALFNWSPNFLDPSRVLEPLFRGGSPSNFSFYSDPGFNDRLDAAATTMSEAERLAEYASLDAQIADQAPALAIGYNLRLDAFQDRIGCRFLSQALFGYAVNRLCISVEESAPPGGTVSTGEDASPSAPLQTSVTVPSGGSVTVTQGQSTTTAPPEYTLLEQLIDISAPEQTPPAYLTIAFELDASVLAGPPALSVDDVVPYRNGVPMPDCTGPGATPDPCVASRTTQGDGDGEIVVRTSAASRWEFGERYDTSGGFLAPIANPPKVNSAGAGKTVALKFGLGGNEGLAILAAGSPSSVRIACASGSPLEAEEPTKSAGAGLTYDAASGSYQYTWKTEKSWAGTCRKLTVRFREGSAITALFSFK